MSFDVNKFTSGCITVQPNDDSYMMNRSDASANDCSSVNTLVCQTVT